MCHQTVSLIARYLEANGWPTMVMGSALDIVAAAKPPRTTFVDYPLGHTSGKPFDDDDQLAIVRSALLGFETLAAPGLINHLGNVWGPNESWRAVMGRSTGEDGREPRRDTPQFQFEADREAAIAAGAL